MDHDWRNVGKGCKWLQMVRMCGVRMCAGMPPPMLKKGKREGVRDALTAATGIRQGTGGKLRACSKRLGFQIFAPK